VVDIFFWPQLSCKPSNNIKLRFSDVQVYKFRVTQLHTLYRPPSNCHSVRQKPSCIFHSALILGIQPCVPGPAAQHSRKETRTQGLPRWGIWFASLLWNRRLLHVLLAFNRRVQWLLSSPRPLPKPLARGAPATGDTIGVRPGILKATSPGSLGLFLPLLLLLRLRFLLKSLSSLLRFPPPPCSSHSLLQLVHLICRLMHQRQGGNIPATESQPETVETCAHGYPCDGVVVARPDEGTKRAEEGQHKGDDDDAE